MEFTLSRFASSFAVLSICYLSFIVSETIGKCQPFQLKVDHLNLRLEEHGFYETTLDLHTCVRFCWYLQDCKSLNYATGTMTCELNDAESTSVQATEFVTSLQTVYSDIVEWPKEIAGTCGSRPCSTKQICLPSFPPRCIDIKCAGLTSVKNGNIELVNPGETLYLDEARVVCNTGYVIDNPISKCSIPGELSEIFSKTVCILTESDSVSCHIDGEWEERTCDLIDCGPPTVENGVCTLLDPSNTTYMAKALVTCNTGYEHSTNIVHTSCQANGIWTTGHCTKISCGALPGIANGVASLAQDGANLYLDTANLQCNYGFTATPPSFKCTSSKAWQTAYCACMPIHQYTGTLSRTSLGNYCQKWIDHFPHSHTYTANSMFPDGSVSAANNYCRSLGENYIWCYTTMLTIRWQECQKPVYICP